MGEGPIGSIEGHRVGRALARGRCRGAHQPHRRTQPHVHAVNCNKKMKKRKFDFFPQVARRGRTVQGRELRGSPCYRCMLRESGSAWTVGRRHAVPSSDHLQSLFYFVGDAMFALAMSDRVRRTVGRRQHQPHEVYGYSSPSSPSRSLGTATSSSSPYWIALSMCWSTTLT